MSICKFNTNYACFMIINRDQVSLSFLRQSWKAS